MPTTLLAPIVAAVSALAPQAPDGLELAALFSDHMVVQRGAPIPVWGWAQPGRKVSVRLGDETAAAVADQDGRWAVKLDALPAGGPHRLVVEAGRSLEIEDVLVGEVWLASGQSNMAMKVQGSKDFDAEKRSADRPLIRMFTVERQSTREPQSRCSGEWQVCSPSTVGEFSATAYFFGRRVQDELDVPVGLINTSWGGTAREGLPGCRWKR